MIEMSAEEAEAAVRHIVAQKKSIEAEFNRVFFDNNPPELWKDWPPDIVVIWDLWTMAFRRVLAEQERRKTEAAANRRRRKREVSLAEAWAAVLESGEHGGEGRYTWRDLGERLHIGARAAEYQLHQKYGFSTTGSAACRTLSRAPCIDCARVLCADELIGCRCKSCLRELDQWVA